jgi:hypothetical protein
MIPEEIQVLREMSVSDDFKVFLKWLRIFESRNQNRLCTLDIYETPKAYGGNTIPGNSLERAYCYNKGVIAGVIKLMSDLSKEIGIDFGYKPIIRIIGGDNSSDE